MNWLKFKGVKIPAYAMLQNVPDPVRFERVTSIIDMPAGTPVVYQSKAYKSQNISIVIGIRPGVFQSSDLSFINTYGRKSFANIAAANALTEEKRNELKITSLYNFLSGAGTLTFSNDSDKYYNAVCNAQQVPERLSKHLKQISVPFTLMPFRYNLAAESYTEIALTTISGGNGDKHAWIPYEGTQPSEPLLKVYGSGTIWMLISGVQYEVRNVSNYFIVDVPKRRVYDASGNVILNRTLGAITDILIDNNSYIRVPKECTKVEIIKNTRWN